MGKEIEIFAIPVTEEIELIDGSLLWDAKKYNDNNRDAIFYVQHIQDFIASILSLKNKENISIVINNIIRDKGKQKNIIELALLLRVSDKNFSLDEGLISTLTNRVSEYIDSINKVTTEISDKARSGKVSFDKMQNEPIASVDEERKQNENNLTIDPNTNKRLNQVLTKAKGAPKLTCYIDGKEKIINEIPNQTNTHESPDAREAIVIINGVIDDKNICRCRMQEVQGGACNKTLELIFKREDRDELIQIQFEYKTLKISYKPTITVINGIEHERGGVLVEFEKYEFPQADFGFNEV
ncbi:hypothetical protein [Marinospirillum insulare]|uniref:Uncharacterized protein n=1 Tax=Marinospirillum insulare TaxID=217169 RepID=A0ABQ5ZYY7_9GAMM|nr:hypothetical protein [Marinospirillum insulare]GLR64508.1 hypothetical protein GCM10007878_19460 [Marinospirillum insulare]